MILGILELMSPGFIEKWHSSTLKKRFNIDSLPVLPCRTFPDMVDSQLINYIHIYVLDVEGEEMSVLMEWIEHQKIRIHQIIYL